MKAELSATIAGQRISQSLSAEYQFPLQVPRVEMPLHPELARLIPKWEKILSEERDRLDKEHGLKCDYWSHPVGMNTSYRGYSLGIEARLDSPDSQYRTAGITIDIRSADREPEVVKAGVVWDGHLKPSINFETGEVNTTGAKTLDEIDENLSEWFRDLEEGLGEKRSAGGNEVHFLVSSGSASTTGETTELESKDLEIWEALLEQRFPGMTGEPLFLFESVGGSPDIGTELISRPRQLAALSSLTPELLDEHDARNESAYVLPRSCRLQDSETVHYNWLKVSRNFYRLYPESPGTFSLTRPAFSSNGKHAILTVKRWSDLEVVWETCFLERVAESWVLKGQVDEMEIFRSWSREDHRRAAEFRFLERLKTAGITIRERAEEFAELQLQDGRKVTVVDARWLSSELRAPRGREPKAKYLVFREPVVVVAGLQEDLVLKALENPWNFDSDSFEAKEPFELKEELLSDDSLLVSISYLGRLKEETDTSWDVIFFKAETKGGRSLTFPVTSPDWSAIPPRPIERLIIMNGFTQEKLVKAIEAYLKMEDE